MDDQSERVVAFLRPHFGQVRRLVGTNAFRRAFVFDAAATRGVMGISTHFKLPHLCQRCGVSVGALVPFAVSTADEFRDFLAEHSEYHPVEPDSQGASMFFYERHSARVYESDGREMLPFGAGDEALTVFQLGLA